MLHELLSSGVTGVGELKGVEVFSRLEPVAVPVVPAGVANEASHLQRPLTAPIDMSRQSRR